MTPDGGLAAARIRVAGAGPARREALAEVPRDWTADQSGRSNSSDAYLALAAAVEGLIREDEGRIAGGGADRTAAVIVAQLAHVYRVAPAESVPAGLSAMVLRQALEDGITLAALGLSGHDEDGCAACQRGPCGFRASAQQRIAAFREQLERLEVPGA